MLPSSDVASLIDNSSHAGSNLTLLSSSNSLVAGLMYASVNVNHANNDISASFSKLNNENIAQMINQAHLLNLNEEVNKVTAAAAMIGKSASNTVDAMGSSLSQNVTSAPAPGNNNPHFFKNNKFNFNATAAINNNNNYHFNNVGHSNNANFNKQRNMQFKNIRPPLNPNLMMMNHGGNYQQMAPISASSAAYLPFGAANFNHSNSFFMQSNTPAPIQTPPSYFYNTNSFNNKQTYLNYKSYLQAKKAEVI